MSQHTNRQWCSGGLSAHLAHVLEKISIVIIIIITTIIVAVFVSYILLLLLHLCSIAVPCAQLQPVQHNQHEQKLALPLQVPPPTNGTAAWSDIS